MINQTALTAAFNSSRFLADFRDTVAAAYTMELPLYMDNKKGKRVFCVSWHNGSVQVYYKGRIIPRIVWMKALYKAGV